MLCNTFLDKPDVFDRVVVVANIIHGVTIVYVLIRKTILGEE